MNTKTGIFALFATCVALGLVRSDIFSPKVGGREKIEIGFWNGWTGPDGRVALQMIRDFNQANPDIEVSMQRIAWATYYNKLRVSAVDGRGPEVFVVHASVMPRMYRSGILDDEEKLFAGPQGVPEGDFEPYVMQQTIFDGKHYGLPLDIHPQGLYCNGDMLKEIGMVNSDGTPRPPQTKEEFLKVMRELLHKPTGSDDPDRYGYALTSWQNNFQSLLPQFGGHYLDDKGRADLNNSGNVAALDFLASLRQKEHLIPPPDNQLGWTGYRQKKVGMVWDGVYMVGDLHNLDNFNYVGAPIPLIGDHKGTMADSHCLCIRKGLDERHRDAAERFIQYFSAHSLEWADAGQVPARKSVRADPKFAKMQVQYAFSKQVPYMMYPPRVVTLFELNVEINRAVESVIRGHATAKEALDLANTNSQKVMDKDAADHAFALQEGKS